MNILGLDIGTTTISTVVIDSASGQVLDSVTIPNRTQLHSPHTFEQLQDPEAITVLAKNMLDTAIAQYAPISIGLAGQMHGILYVGKDGCALSPLFTWQDRRGDQPYGPA